jgi:hypothetical protein
MVFYLLIVLIKMHRDPLLKFKPKETFKIMKFVGINNLFIVNGNEQE